MASLSEDIQSTGFDTRPPMLDMSDFESWKQRIHLYYKGKDNGENILQSIDEGSFQMGKFKETLADGIQGPEWDRVFKDLTPEENERYKADIRATNILLQARQCTHPKRPHNSNYFKDKMLLMQAQENGVVLDEEQLLFIIGGQDNTFDVDEPSVQDLALNTIFMANLSSADLIYNEAGPSYDSNTLSEYVKNNIEQVIQSNVSSVPNDVLMMIINDMHEQATQFKTNHAPAVVHDSEDTLELAEITRKKMLETIKSLLCVEKKIKIAPPDYSKENYFATFTPQRQLKDNTIRTLKEKISHMTERRSEVDRSLDVKALISQNKELIENVTTLQEQNEPFRAENEKVKQHYKELYDSIKITRAKTIEKTSSLLTKNEKLKAQLKGKMECVTMNTVKLKVLASGMYAIDVEPIPPHNRNNSFDVSMGKDTRHIKTPYELVYGKKPDLIFLRVFGALCYPTNDSEDLGNLKAKVDIGIFVGYAPNRKGPEPILMTPGQISSRLVPNSVPAALYVPPTNKDLKILFQSMFNEYFEPPSVERLIPPAPAV
nr:integrase, catalytic region, zinc finger, CCHC-type, peptidase aspartic, catalytic [Tanacetum cinerariifolium]